MVPNKFDTEDVTTSGEEIGDAEDDLINKKLPDHIQSNCFLKGEKRMKQKGSKPALAASLIVLSVCSTVLIGNSFSWFTDNVVSSDNMIKTGELKVSMKWEDGKKTPSPSDDWKDAAEGQVFKYDKWEPGFTQARHIAISNDGTLALKYKVLIEAEDGTVDTDFAGVIDVYYSDPAKKVENRTDVDDLDYIGTLASVLENNAGINNTAQGTLLPGQKDVVTIVLKMKETAGNTYQEKSIGSSFAVKLFATQWTYEADSFDKQYDKDAVYEDDIYISPAQTLTSPDGKITVTVPKGAAAQDDIYTLEATYELTDNSAGEYTVTADITLKKNGIVVEDGTVDYPVTVQVGEDLNIISVKHKNEPIPYSYSNGIVSFSTRGFSTFTISYSQGEINGAEDD